MSLIQSSNEYPFKRISEEYLVFIQYERSRPVSPQTLFTHTKRIRKLQELWGDKDIRKITKEDANAIKIEMLRRKLKIKYVHTILSIVRAFLRYCREERKIKRVLDPRDVKLPAESRHDVDFLTPIELEKFIRAIDTTTLSGLRFMAFVTTLLDTGMRISEALSVNRDSIEFKPDGTGRAQIIGKGSKPGMVFFREWSLSWIKRYLDARQDSHEALFVTCNGTDVSRILPEGIRKYFRSYGEKAGINRTVKPHMMRRTGATYLRENGADVHDIQKWLRHSKLHITERYIGTNWQKVQESIVRFQTYGVAEHIQAEVKVLKAVWSKDGKWKKCQKCHRSDRPYAAQGHCRTCYTQFYRLTRKQKAVRVSAYADATENQEKQGNIRLVEEYQAPTFTKEDSKNIRYVCPQSA